MKKFLRIILIGLLIVATSFAVACKNSKPWNPPTNDFGDGYNGGIGNVSPGVPDGDDIS